MPTQVPTVLLPIDSTAPTVTLTDTDSDNLVSTSEVVTITAGFSEAMTATPQFPSQELLPCNYDSYRY